jgi:hypothetical protein
LLNNGSFGRHHVDLGGSPPFHLLLYLIKGKVILESLNLLVNEQMSFAHNTEQYFHVNPKNPQRSINAA